MTRTSPLDCGNGKRSIRSMNTDGKTYLNGLRYRIAIKYSTEHREWFGPMIGQRGLLNVTADGAYVDVDRVNEYAEHLKANSLAIYKEFPHRAHEKAHETAINALGFIHGELDRVLREALAARRVSKWIYGPKMRVPSKRKQFLEVA